MNHRMKLAAIIMLGLSLVACGDEKISLSEAKAFVLLTDEKHNVCYQDQTTGLGNTAFSMKYITLNDILENSPNSILKLLKKCPEKALAYCDDNENIRQFFYEEAVTEGNENFIYSKKLCEDKQGKWTTI